eukprot:gene4571-6444_t
MATKLINITKFHKITSPKKILKSLYHAYPAPFSARYGAGGRSSNSGITATVFGGYGFLGRYLVNELGSCGSRVYIPYRGCEMEVRLLKPMFDLGQLGLIPFSPDNEESIIESIKRSDIVINFIGKHYETKHLVPTLKKNGNISFINYTFEDVNVNIPAKIAELSKKAGVKNFVHVSALAADLTAESRWAQTKAQGEIAVREAFPDAIIVKPATVFGAEDRFLNRIGYRLKRHWWHQIIDGGSNLLQPVYVNDVAKAVFNIITRHEEFQGKTFQLAGPAEYSYKEVVEFVSDITRRKRKLVGGSYAFGYGLASINDWMIEPVYTTDYLKQTKRDVVALNNPELLTFKDLDIEPKGMESVAFDFLHRFREGGHFYSRVSGYH